MEALATLGDANDVNERVTSMLTTLMSQSITSSKTSVTTAPKNSAHDSKNHHPPTISFIFLYCYSLLELFRLADRLIVMIISRIHFDLINLLRCGWSIRLWTTRYQFSFNCLNRLDLNFVWFSISDLCRCLLVPAA